MKTIHSTTLTTLALFAVAKGTNLRAEGGADRQLQSLPPPPPGFSLLPGACRLNANNTGKGSNFREYIRTYASTIDQCVSNFHGSKSSFLASFDFKAFEFSPKDKSCELWIKEPLGFASNTRVGCYVPTVSSQPAVQPSPQPSAAVPSMAPTFEPVIDTVHDFTTIDPLLPIVHSKDLGPGWCYDSSGLENSFPESDLFPYVIIDEEIITLDDAILACLNQGSSEFLVGLEFNDAPNKGSHCLYSFDIPEGEFRDKLLDLDEVFGVGLPVDAFPDTDLQSDANTFNCKRLIVEGGFFDT